MRSGKRLRAVVFDFDGTLAHPVLDFALMKRRIAGLAARHLGSQAEPGALPALEWIESLARGMDSAPAASFRDEAHDLIQGMELKAAARTTLFPFSRPALDFLRGRGVASAVITRNSRQAVSAVFPDFARYLPVLLTREDVDSVKPDPAHLLAALNAVGALPEEAMMVGDHPLDVLTARRAKAFAGAVASGGTSREELALASPDILAPDAGELLAQLDRDGWI